MTVKITLKRIGILLRNLNNCRILSLFLFLPPFFHLCSNGFVLIRYLERNPQLWHPNHNVVVKEIENVNKIKIGLYVNHTMNFQNFGEKNKRRTELMMELKRILEELNIRYNLLPQAVHLSHVGSETSVLKK